MSKIICEVCGTTYPETAAACPICGCARPEKPQTLELDASGEKAGGTYTYVKGGRFSKSNVRKRNNMAKAVPAYSDDEPEDEGAPSDSNRGLTIAIIVLLLAIIAVAVYIYIRFFMPAADSKPNLTTPGTVQTTPVETTAEPITTPTPETTPEPTTTPAPQTTPATVACTGISLTDPSLTFSQLGSTWDLAAKAEPANTTDVITYSSSDTNVVSVDASGKVTAVGEGSATITVTCGDMSTKCVINVVLPTEPPKNLKFNVTNHEGQLTKGERFVIKLRDEDKNVMEVTDWSSSNQGVATVNKAGTITAVGKGTCIIRCTYNGITYECTIHVVNP